MIPFKRRHIGPDSGDVSAMLKTLGFSTLDEMARQVIPKTIRTEKLPGLGEALSEFELLKYLKNMMSQNKLNRSLIGQGYYNTITPTVIQRNIFENPVWYTAYTPYQPEIAQGRLEALLNFQTMVTDLTGMEIANASLLDEGTAAAEAVNMAHSLSKTDSKRFVVSPLVHPHVLEVLKTRTEPLGLEMVIENPETYNFAQIPFAVVVGYPDTHGNIHSWKELSDKAHKNQSFVIATTDLMALTLLTPPGEWGADIVVGNSQRFGVPLGFGGPHAGFLATKDQFKRQIPGRLVGVSVDNQGQPALRLALQTREQHIRREKATSNICTAQVLLANMASMYAVYHGPKGLKEIAEHIHNLTIDLAARLKSMGYEFSHKTAFDTLTIKTPKAKAIYAEALKHEINLRLDDANHIGLSLDETCDQQTVDTLSEIFGAFADSSKAHPALGKATITPLIPTELYRKSAYLTHPVFNTHRSETELLRYIHMLQNKDITLTHSMIPLGSCTMKLNATSELAPVSWPEISSLHPFTPLDQCRGYIQLIKDLEDKLCKITGFSAISLQPNSGAQGEFAGLLVIRKYFQSRNEAHRDICLIPASAHGTNPASAVLAGMKVVVINSDDNGNIDIGDLKAKAELHKNNLAALMVTYPSTHGVFEEGIVEICEIIHKNGGQVYMDGANLNALVAVARPGEFGPDVSHMNLHKTFAIPHGGGGPGVGPIGVRAHLAPFLPTHSIVKEAGPSTGVSAVTSAPWGSASILPISWSYITMMGDEGLREATLVSILSANYLAKKLEDHYPVVYRSREGLVAHECIIDIRPFKKTAEIEVTDIAKRLMDYGFHSPTMSWPVAGTLMIEPTESESKAELDRFIDAMVAIRNEIREIENGKADRADNPLKHAPHTARVLMANEWPHKYSREKAGYPLPWIKNNKIFPAVGRVDNAHGDRNLVCSCPPIESYGS
ncbi:MAG: aminomethyl-transferring glycine dehydrogenase [Bdellovibrionota bacterium]